MKKKDKNSAAKQISTVKKQHLPFYILNQYPSSIVMKLQQKISNFYEDLQNNSSSIYQMDSKAYLWIQKVQNLSKMVKDVLKLIDKLKKQVQHIEQVKQNAFLMEVENQKIKNEALELKNQTDQQIQSVWKDNQVKEQKIKELKDKIQQFIEQKDSLVTNYENEIKQLKTRLIEKQEKNKQISQQIRQTEKLLNEKQELIKIINKQCIGLQQKEEKTNYKLDIDQNKAENMPTIKQKQPNQINNFERQVFHDITICKHIISFLNPQSFINLFSLNKLTRTILIKSSSVRMETYLSVIRIKNKQMSYFHRHIQHFQKLSEQIPQEIIQNMFFQYFILKQNIGGDFMTILNNSAQIFQGKIMNASQINKNVKEYIQSKQIMHHFEMPKEITYLKVDQKIIKLFFDQRKIKKQHFLKEIQAMHTKIVESQQFYHADTQTLEQFNTNLIKTFTILFVLSKNLFTDVRNLQKLTEFLLGHLSKLDEFQIEKKYDLQDIKAQLLAQRRMKQFLSQKCHKSQERLLKQNQQNLELQKTLLEHIGRINEYKKKLETMSLKIQKKQQQIQAILLKNKDIKKAYLRNKQRYNQLVRQLNSVKETILKMSMS